MIQGVFTDPVVTEEEKVGCGGGCGCGTGRGRLPGLCEMVGAAANIANDKLL